MIDHGHDQSISIVFGSHVQQLLKVGRETYASVIAANLSLCNGHDMTESTMFVHFSAETGSYLKVSMD